MLNLDELNDENELSLPTVKPVVPPQDTSISSMFPGLKLGDMQKEQDDVSNKKRLISTVGNILQGFENTPTAYELLSGHKTTKNDYAGNFNSLADSIKDPWEKQKRTYELYKAAQDAKKTGLDQEKLQLQNAATKESSDPASRASVNARSVYGKVLKAGGVSDEEIAQMSASEIGKAFEGLNKREKLENDKIDRQSKIALLQAQLQDRKSQKQEKDDEKKAILQTPFGLANTADDAKQLKEAYESKRNFDGKIQELIGLRQKYGGELMNREAVARGKQLSKDLLLEYKNMAKLGVLSKSDEDIINAIIPADPLEFSLVPGQDPIMNNMKKFKDDSDKDFSTRIATRTRAGTKELQSGDPMAQGSKPEKTVVKTQVNQKTGQTRVIYSDGTVEVQPMQAGK